MDFDGRNKRQLTFFNTPEHKHYIKKKFIASADSSWSPDGKRLIAFLITGDPNTDSRGHGFNVMIEFEKD